MTSTTSHLVSLLSSLWCLAWVALADDISVWVILLVAATARSLTVLWLVVGVPTRPLGLGVLTLHLFLPVLVTEL
jgi:hypothetical protein